MLCNLSSLLIFVKLKVDRHHAKTYNGSKNVAGKKQVTKSSQNQCVSIQLGNLCHFTNVFKLFSEYYCADGDGWDKTTWTALIHRLFATSAHFHHSGDMSHVLCPTGREVGYGNVSDAKLCRVSTCTCHPRDRSRHVTTMH